MKRYPLEDWRREASDYRPDSDEFDPEGFRRMARVGAFYADYFSTVLRGVEHVPSTGPALLVGNHGVWGLDSPALISRLYEATGRIPRPLAEHLLVKLPVVGDWIRRLGVVDGRPANAVRLLRAGQLVLVYPGGHRAALKHAESAYQLQWDHARGYIRCALRAGSPILPVAGVGIDEAYVTLGHERLIGRLMFGREDYDFPVTLGLGPLPLPVRFRFVIGPPIAIDLPPAAADDDQMVESLHARVRQTTQALIDRERARRFSPASD